MRKILYLLALLCGAQLSNATTLDEFSPRPIGGNPWSDAWYYYINDPEVGYYKIVFLTYLNESTVNDKPQAYLHVVFAPKNGEKREYDYYFKDVTSKPVKGEVPYAFVFEVPGIATIDEDSIDIRLPDVSIQATLTGDHLHYAAGGNPGASPFGWLTSLPFVQNQWFVFSMATPTRYTFRDAHAQHRGEGLTYIDRGWNSGQAAGMVYLMAVSDDVKMMFTGGADKHLPIETWTGRLITDKYDLTFTPSINGMAADANFSPCGGTALIEMNDDGYRVSIDSRASLDTFYNHVTPSMTVFHSENPVMKSMQARAVLKLFRDEELLDTYEIDQSVLEFGGIHYCDKLKGKGQAKGLH